MPWPHQFARAATFDVGGTSKVYKCRDALGTTAICKVIQKKPRLEFKARKEIACLSDLGFSPYVVRMYDALESTDEYFILMEWCRGGSVRGLIEGSHACTEDETRDILRGTLRALAHAHGCAIIHRDIKPGNVLLSGPPMAGRRLDVKLADFGSAERMPSTAITDFEIGDIVGTVPFMPPESLRSRLGPKSDIWSVGVMAYMMLTGVMPFQDWDHLMHPTMRGVWKSILNEQPSWVVKGWASVSDQAMDFCKNCLQKEMDARPSAEEALQHPWLAEPVGFDGPFSVNLDFRRIVM